MNESDQLAYDLGNIVPLFAGCSGDLIAAYDLDRDRYLIFYLDGGVATSDLSWDELLSDWFGNIVEDYWVSNRKFVEELALIFRFNSLDKILVEYELSP